MNGSSRTVLTSSRRFALEIIDDVIRRERVAVEAQQRPNIFLHVLTKGRQNRLDGATRANLRQADVSHQSVAQAEASNGIFDLPTFAYVSIDGLGRAAMPQRAILFTVILPEIRQVTDSLPECLHHGIHSALSDDWHLKWKTRGRRFWIGSNDQRAVVNGIEQGSLDRRFEAGLLAQSEPSSAASIAKYRATRLSTSYPNQGSTWQKH